MTARQQIARLERRIRSVRPVERACVFHVYYADDPIHPVHSFYHYPDGRIEHRPGAHGQPVAWLDRGMYETAMEAL